MGFVIYIIKHINFLLLIGFSDKKLREERRDQCFVELEGEDNFSNYALYCFPFIGYFGKESEIIEKGKCRMMFHREKLGLSFRLRC